MYGMTTEDTPPRDTPPRIRLHIRRKPNNPNHHLWNNNGRWWMCFTISRPDGASERKRISLKTADLDKARGRRDGIIADLQNKAHVFG
jgi:hypothetical protein